MATVDRNITVVKHASFAFSENQALWILGGNPVHNPGVTPPSSERLSQFVALDLSQAWNASQPIFQPLTPNKLGRQSDVPMVFAPSPKSNNRGAVYAFGHDHSMEKKENATTTHESEQQGRRYDERQATNMVHVYNPEKKQWTISSLLLPRTNTTTTTNNQTSSTLIRHRIHEAVADPDSTLLYLLSKQAVTAEEQELPPLYIFDTQSYVIREMPLPPLLLATYRAHGRWSWPYYLKYPYQAVWSRSRKSLLVMGEPGVTVMDHSDAGHSDDDPQSNSQAVSHAKAGSMVGFQAVNEFRNGSWTTHNTTGDVPFLSSVVCIASAYNGTLIILYGQKQELTRIYTLNTTTMVWHTAVRSVSARHKRSGAACAVSGHDYFLVWGGEGPWQVDVRGHDDDYHGSGIDLGTVGRMAVSVLNLQTNMWVDRYEPAGKDHGSHPSSPSPQPTSDRTQSPTPGQEGSATHASSGHRFQAGLTLTNALVVGCMMLLMALV
ncbi:hypothetical protein DFQ26_004263 [Actinomortierella ambigua]|nr:hypothetical protein DFQ26_004263 [Actinomortierella ambigua]